MVKKIIAVCAAAILVTAAFAGCGCENSSAKETPTTSTSQPAKVVVSDLKVLVSAHWTFS